MRLTLEKVMKSNFYENNIQYQYIIPVWTVKRVILMSMVIFIKFFFIYSNVLSLIKAFQKGGPCPKTFGEVQNVVILVERHMFFTKLQNTMAVIWLWLILKAYLYS